MKWFPIEGLAAHNGSVAGITDESAIGVFGEDGKVHFGARSSVDGVVQTVTLELDAAEALNFAQQILTAVRAANGPMPHPNLSLVTDET